MRRLFVSVLAWFGLVGPSPAWGHETFLDALRGLEGDWRGVLAYTDYRSGEREVIGQAARITVSPDRNFISFEGRFTDPGFDVYILTVATIDKESGALVESYHRDRDIQRQVYELVSFTPEDDGWRAVVQAEDRDDGQPALLRRTFTRAGDTLTRRKDVNPLGDDDDRFVFRNETVMTLSDEPVTFDDFRQAD